jgi:hypothetical protein
MQDLVDATCEQPRSEQGDTSSEHDPLRDLLERLRRPNLVAPETSSARAGIRATTPEDRQFWLRRETAYPYGDPLAQVALGRSPRREQASARQAHESAPQSHAAARAPAAPAYQANWKTAADDDPGSYASDPPAANPLLCQPRVPRRVALAITGIVGSILIATLGALGYYALSASNTTGQAPVIADNVVEEKTWAAGQNDYGEERSEQGASTSWSDQPKKVRTVTIAPDMGAANPPAVEPSVNARSELNASAMLRAPPNADERAEGGAASLSAPAFLDPQSELNASPARRAGPNVDDQDKARTSVARAQVPARNGEIACRTSAGRGGYWAWRIIDGRKCWYEGKVGMSKDNLRWVRSAE